MLFNDQPEVHELVAGTQEKIAGQPGLDMIPMPWLHMTTYIVGFADEAAADMPPSRSWPEAVEAATAATSGG